MKTVCVFSASLRPSTEKWFSLVVFPLVAITEDQVKDVVRRGLLAAYILCDTAPQTKRSVIERLLSLGIHWTRNAVEQRMEKCVSVTSYRVFPD